MATRLERLLTDAPPKRAALLKEMEGVYYGVDDLFEFLDAYRAEIVRLKKLDAHALEKKVARLEKKNSELVKENARLTTWLHGHKADLEILRAASPADPSPPSIRGVRRE